MRTISDARADLVLLDNAIQLCAAMSAARDYDVIREAVYESIEREGAEPLKFGELWDTVREILKGEGLTEHD